MSRERPSASWGPTARQTDAGCLCSCHDAGTYPKARMEFPPGRCATTLKQKAGRTQMGTTLGPLGGSAQPNYSAFPDVRVPWSLASRGVAKVQALAQGQRQLTLSHSPQKSRAGYVGMSGRRSVVPAACACDSGSCGRSGLRPLG